MNPTITNRSRRGYTIIIIIAFLPIMAIAVSGMLMSIDQQSRESRRIVARAQARAAAQGAMALAHVGVTAPQSGAFANEAAYSLAQSPDGKLLARGEAVGVAFEKFTCEIEIESDTGKVTALRATAAQDEAAIAARKERLRIAAEAGAAALALETTATQSASPD